MEAIEFGDLLFRHIRKRGWSMTSFAEQVGVSPSTISRIRNGRRHPSEAQIQEWIALLELDSDQAGEFEELALLAKAPEALRRRMLEAQTQARDASRRADDLAVDFGAFRQAHSFFDGWWLAYNYAFRNDGTVLRSLAEIQGDTVRWRAMEDGCVQYAYHGRVEVLGDKAFFLMQEDRGNVEHVQVVMHSLFDYREPAFLHGLICGISGTSIRSPRSEPTAARMVMIYVGCHESLRRRPELAAELEGLLGTFHPERLGDFCPERLGDFCPEHLPQIDQLRRCLGLRPREDMNAVLAKMLDNHLASGETVLAAKLGTCNG